MGRGTHPDFPSHFPCIVWGPYLLPQCVGVLFGQDQGGLQIWCYPAKWLLLNLHPSPSMPHCPTLITVFSSLLHRTIFPEGLWVIRDVISFQCHVFFAQEFIRLFWKVVPLFYLIVSGVPCCHKTCLSRPEMVFTENVASQPVVSSTMVSMYHVFGVFMAVVQSTRSHHTGNPAATLCSRESLLQWHGWLQHMLLIHEWSV